MRGDPDGVSSVTNRDARRLLAGMYAADDERFDIVDVDSFGVDNFVDAALPMVKHGGYAYVTCTDALALCGKNPRRVGSFGGAHVAANVAGVNETALRVFVGDAVRRGAAQGLKLTPVFSLFHPHGPVFRAMLRVEPAREIGTAGTSARRERGPVRGVRRGARELDGGKELGGCFCHQCADAGDVNVAMDVSGPMWLGPLHERETIRRLRARKAGRSRDDSRRRVRVREDERRRPRDKRPPRNFSRCSSPSQIRSCRRSTTGRTSSRARAGEWSGVFRR